MNNSWKKIIRESSARENILHLTSICPNSCIFCSHKYNPPGVEVFAPGHIPLDLIRELIEYFNPAETVRIGESVTRVIEGEPLAHPDFFRALYYFRKRHPQTPLEIVTSGTLIDPGTMGQLADYHPLRLKLSLNILDPSLRNKYLGSGEQNMEELMEGLAQKAVPFGVTLVALPHLTGWKALDDTIRGAAARGPRDITVFRPAITRLAPSQIGLKGEQSEKLEKELARLRRELETPILLEPTYLQDLRPQVAGVRQDSPAARGGLQSNDVLLQIGENQPASRIEAHQLLQKKGGTIPVLVEREKTQKQLYLEKKAQDNSGAIFYRDLPSTLIQDIKKACGGEKTALITSTAAYPLLREAFAGSNIAVWPIKNELMGGTINSAGLLGVTDIIRQKDKRPRPGMLEKLILPGVMFDQQGRDLWGRKISELEEVLGIECLAYPV